MPFSQGLLIPKTFATKLSVPYVEFTGHSLLAGKYFEPDGADDNHKEANYAAHC